MNRAAWAALAAVVVTAPPAWADENDQLLRDLQALQAPPAGPASEAALRQLVDSTLPRVARVMGLSAPANIKLKAVSRDEARAKLLELLRRDYPGDTLTRLGALLVAVGLCDPGRDLTREATAMYAQSASGFYDPHEKVLFLLADQPLDAQALIVAHELAHAVQDEHLGLDAASLERRGSEDAQLAFSAAIEGQAQEVASQVMASQLAETGLDMNGLTDLLSEATAASAGQAAAQAGVPWLGMQMSFPYAAGAHFISALKRPDDRVARAVLRRLPESTAAVLSPAIYLRADRPRQGAINLAEALPGSVPLYSTTLGRANLDLFGQLHGGGDLGEGWRGDRAEAVRLEGRVAAAWVVAFDTPAQAERLATSMASALHGRVGVKSAQPDGSWYLVQSSGAETVLMEGISDSQVAAIQKAAFLALGAPE